MSTSIVGVRVSRNAPVVFADSNGFAVSVGDQVLIETSQGRSLAVASIAAEQIKVIPAQAIDARIVARAGSPEVVAAISERDRSALELVRAEIEPRVHLVGAHWSADVGRLTVEVTDAAVNPKYLAERLEPVVRAEVVCQVVAKSSTPG